MVSRNKLNYMKEYKKEHYSQFLVSLKIDEKKELDELLGKNNMTKADFLRTAIEILKNHKELFK